MTTPQPVLRTDTASSSEVEIKELEIQTEGGLSTGIMVLRLAVLMTRAESMRNLHHLRVSVGNNIKKLLNGEPIEVI